MKNYLSPKVRKPSKPSKVKVKTAKKVWTNSDIEQTYTKNQ